MRADARQYACLSHRKITLFSRNLDVILACRGLSTRKRTSNEHLLRCMDSAAWNQREAEAIKSDIFDSDAPTLGSLEGLPSKASYEVVLNRAQDGIVEDNFSSRVATTSTISHISHIPHRWKVIGGLVTAFILCNMDKVRNIAWLIHSNANHSCLAILH